MRVIIALSLLTATASAAPVHLVQQGRLLDAAGDAVHGSHTVVVDLCPNAVAIPGETCRAETFDNVPFQDGYFSLVLGAEQTLDHSIFDAPDLFVQFTISGSALGDRQRVGQFIPRRGGMLFLGSAADSDCTDDTNEGALIYRGGAVQVCTGGGWRSLAYGETLTVIDGVHQWSDGSFGASCEDYIRPLSDARLYVGATGNGVYRIDPSGSSPFNVWCDMTSEEGGFTLVMNLDTSDGHAMWWGNALWTNGNTYGTADSNPFDGDLVSQAYSQLAGADEVRIVVHEQGVSRGFKRWNKPNTTPLISSVNSADNTVLGSSVASSDTSSLSSSEFLVRTTTTLYANHCVNGTCVTDSGGSPDGHRIGSNQAAPTNNNGGGLGNWADMNYCCAISSLAGHSCNGQTVRTASEAQGGWFATYGGSNNTGTFGTDSLFPFNPTATNTSCTQANWAQTNGINYDYAIYVR
jgi:hypothetical protein